MCVEGIGGILDYQFDDIGERKEGSDGQRNYTILESGQICGCLSKGMKNLGIEKIAFQVYQLAEEKFFDMHFDVSLSEGLIKYLHFSRETLPKDSREFFSKVQKAATAVGASGLTSLTNQAIVLATTHQAHPMDTPYFRCMKACDDVEFEPIRLICYAYCTFFVENKQN